MDWQKKYDLDYRPESYWDAPWREMIKGQWRREVIDAALAEGNVEAVPREMFAVSIGKGPGGRSAGTSRLTGKLGAFADILNGRPSDDPREQAGAVHPGALGGEYLPDTRDREVEIARIISNNISRDVISLRATPLKSKIRYSIVDEYGWEYHHHIRYFWRPLSFEQLILQINRSWCMENEDLPPGLATGFSDFNYSWGAAPQSLVGFSRVQSAFYPGAAGWFKDQWDVWLDCRLHPKKYDHAERDPLLPGWWG
jgi:hypothetical protein